jgi:phage terminase large subunit GpA-like protein
MPADLQAVLARVLGLLAPPERLPLSAWADEHRQLSSEGSAAPGPWRTLSFQREPLDAVAPGSPYGLVVLVWASQLGKSELLMNLLSYVIAVEPGPMLLVEPTLAMCEAFSKDRLSPLFRDTPVLKGKVAESKSREAGSTIYHRRFHGGHLTLVGSNSPSGLAARPIRYLLLDEVDRYEQSAGAEGDPTSLAIARTRTFYNRKIVMVSSPTMRGASRIESAWLESDQREFELPCPYCSHYQQLRWERLEWPAGNPRAAVYRCEGCSQLLEHHLKPDMVERGRWQTKAASANIAGFRLSELISPWRSWGDLAADWTQTIGQPERRRAFVNTSLAEWWTEEAQQMPAAEVLAARCEVYSAEVPQPVALLTAGADLQHDRIEVETVGWGRGFESWSIRYDVIYGDPSGPHLWQQLDALLSREFKHESGMPLRISSACVDCGFLTDEVLSFVRDKFSRRIYGVKGLNSGFSKPIWPRKAVYNRKQLPLFLISVDEGKRWLYQRLRIAQPGSGHCHFPLGRPLDYFRGLLSETLLTRYRGGRPHLEWVNLKRERNEPLDCRVYSIAGLFALIMSGLNLDTYCENWERMIGPSSGAIATQLPAISEKFHKPPGQSVSRPTIFRSKFVNGQ